MDQDKTDGVGREQTLLEAAKVFIGDVWDSTSLRNLRAAIARAESETMDFHKTNLPHIDRARKAEDRAQQAEADAKWHREESARLSAELAKERERTASTATDWRRQVDQVREEAEAAPDEPTIDAVTSLRQRAEKAEAELAKLRAHVAKSLSMPPESTTDDLIDTDLVVLTSVINDLARAGVPTPLKVRDAVPEVVDELLRLRAELANSILSEAEPAKKQAPAAEPRDPATGWTFDTMRQQFDAARTTVRVLAAELVAARQQIAGTKGFQAKEVG